MALDKHPMSFFNKLRISGTLNLPLFGSCLVLNLIGLAMLYSLTSSNPNDTRFTKQVVFTILGLVVFFIVTSISHQLVKGYTWPLYGAAIASLVLVLLVGTTIRGTRGWFTIAGLNIQPVEFVKLILILCLAQLFSRITDETLSWKHIALAGILTAIPIALVALQPDFGSNLIMLIIFLGMLAIRKISWQKVLLITLIIAVAGAASWFLVFKDYQKERVETFIGLKEDPYGTEYNVKQSIIAIGAGGVWGRGLGFGSQSQLRFLPESATDFIFSSTAEELGLLGSVTVLTLFATLFLRILTIFRQGRDSFSGLFALGIGIVLFAHFAVNIGTTMGLIPVAGVPLPFMSYGGSFLVTCWIAHGLLQGIHRSNSVVH